MPVFKHEYLQGVGREIFRGFGAPDDEADQVAQSLVSSNLAGHDSHGVIRIPQYIERVRDGLINVPTKIEVGQETASTAILNGNWGFGQVIARRAMEIAIGKAAECAISSVGVHNCNHVGRLGEYPAMASDRGMIAIAMVNNHGAGLCMAPYGGIERRLSPNPISIALPAPPGIYGSDEAAGILLDATSSVTAEGKVRVKLNRGESVPEGWITDAKGLPTTNPADFYGPPQGALLPMGGVVGHKGFGLAFVFDMLCGALTGAGCSRPDATRIGNGLFIIVIDIEKFLPLNGFMEQVTNLVAYVKSSKLTPGFEEILVPGEIEAREKAKRLKEGIFIEDETWRQISECAKEAERRESEKVRK